MMRTPRPFRWMESTTDHGRAKGRHAYPAELEIAQGDELVAIAAS